MISGKHDMVRISCVDYTKDGRRILDDVSISIGRGVCVRIAGGNGAGKTTLLRLIHGTIHPDGGIAPTRVYEFDDECTPSPIVARRHIRLVSPAQQDEYRRKGWNLSGEEIVATGFDDTQILYRDLSVYEKRRVCDIADWLDISTLMGKSILSMSRGEGRKVLIARAVVSSPSLVLFDEFLHELDAISRREISEIIGRIIEEGSSVVYTTHRDDEILPMTESTVFLDRGRIVGAADAADAAGRIYSSRNGSSGFADVELNQSETGCFFDLHCCSVYLDGHPVLKSVSLKMDRGENWAVVGANGSGKSTFMNLLYGRHRPALGGSIERFGEREAISFERLRRRMGYLSSDLQSRYDAGITGIDVVASGFSGSVGVMEVIGNDERVSARGVLEEIGCGDLADREFGTMSYGEQRKVLFARAIVHRPEVLILDEPFAGLDSGSRNILMTRIERYAGEGGCVVIAVHHPEDIPGNVTYIAHIERGKIAYSGLVDAFPVREYLSGI